MIRTEFDVLDEDDKVEGHDLSQFGYMSVHFVARLRRKYVGPRYDSIQGVAFEIQVRTILMDAWANVSHYLDYKGDTSVPSDLRKDFYALSGLFYVADKHFELFALETANSRQVARESIDADAELDIELNLDTFLAYLATKFPDRQHATPADVSELVEEIAPYGYSTLRDVDRDIDRGLRATLAYENDDPPSLAPEDEGFNPDLEHKDQPTRYVDVGMVRASLSMANPAYRAGRHSPSATRNIRTSWSNSLGIAQRGRGGQVPRARDAFVLASVAASP
jgi:hypothetical protein